MSISWTSCCFFVGVSFCAVLWYMSHIELAKLAQVGLTALIRAVQQGRVNCVHLLLDGGADKNATDNVRIFAVLLLDVCSKVLGIFLTSTASMIFTFA